MRSALCYPIFLMTGKTGFFGGPPGVVKGAPRLRVAQRKLEIGGAFIADPLRRGAGRGRWPGEENGAGIRLGN
jgi:hypothetical protein